MREINQTKRKVNEKMNKKKHKIKYIYEKTTQKKFYLC